MTNNADNEDLSSKFKRFERSGELGVCHDPETKRALYRGTEGLATVEYSFDPDREEIVNGRRCPIDMTH